MEEPREKRRVGLLEYLRVVVKRWTLIFSIFAVVFIAGVIFALSSAKVYKAACTLRMAIKSPILAVIPEFSPSSRYYDPMQSQLEIVRSRSVGEIAVYILGINFSVVENPDSLVIDSVAISPVLSPGSYTLLVESDKVIVKDSRENEIARGKVGSFFMKDGVGFKIRRTRNQASRLSFDISDPSIYVDGLRGMVSIKQIPQTDLAQIVATSGTPEVAAKVANAWAQAYVEYTLLDLKREATQTRGFLEKQLSIVEESLKDAEKRLEKFKKETGVMILDVSTADLVNRIALIERNKADAETDLQEDLMRLSFLRSQLKGSSGSFGEYRRVATSPDISSNPLMVDLRRRLASLETEKARLLEKYTENHPEVLEIDQQIEQVKKDMAAVVAKALSGTPAASDPVFQTLFQDLIATETNVNALKGRIEGIDAILTEYEAQLRALPTTERELAELQREVETGKSVYSLISKKLEDARIAEATTVPEARIIDEALVPSKPSNVGILRQLFLAALLGLILGVLGAYAMEAVRTTVDTPEEAEEILGFPTIAVIPRIRSSTKPKLKGAKKFLLTNLRPRHPAREAYRVLRTNLLLTQEKAQPMKTLLVTSAQPEDGKSLTAANLALTCALMGDRVLLIDADPRKPLLHEFFDVPNEAGFIDVVAGRASLDSVKEIPQIPNLFLMTSGRMTGEYELPLRPEGIERLLLEVRDRFDLVILDNSPMTVGADPIEIGSRVDGILLVIRAESTSNAILARVKEMARRANLPLMGVVFNGLRPSAEYYYAYTRYYGYGYTEERKGALKWLAGLRKISARRRKKSKK